VGYEGIDPLDTSEPCLVLRAILYSAMLELTVTRYAGTSTRHVAHHCLRSDLDERELTGGKTIFVPSHEPHSVTLGSSGQKPPRAQRPAVERKCNCHPQSSAGAEVAASNRGEPGYARYRGCSEAGMVCRSLISMAARDNEENGTALTIFQ